MAEVDSLLKKMEELRKREASLEKELKELSEKNKEERKSLEDELEQTVEELLLQEKEEFLKSLENKDLEFEILNQDFSYESKKPEDKKEFNYKSNSNNMPEITEEQQEAAQASTYQSKKPAIYKAENPLDYISRKL